MCSNWLNSAIGIFTAITLMLALTDCTGHSSQENVLVQFGDESLTLEQLQQAIPSGLSCEDSINVARNYIRAWIDQRITDKVVASKIDMDEIDKMVERYRRQLIMWEYANRMFEKEHSKEYPEDSLRNYYENNKTEFTLKRPLVKGIYIKVADDCDTLDILRQCYKSYKTEDIDRLEKAALHSDVKYEYFRDRWVDWDQIETLIPADFGPSPTDFLKSHSYFEFQKDGYTYLLSISDKALNGQTMPFEAAKARIIERLTFRDRRAYELTLKELLYDNALSEGQFKIFCDLGP